MVRDNNSLRPAPFTAMNLDKSPRAIDWSSGEYGYALNMRFYPDGILKSHDGMVEIPWDKPAGVNTPVGAAESRSLDGDHLNAAYIFFHNSLGNHSIVAIWDDLSTQVIFQDPALELTKDLGGAFLLYEKAMMYTDPSAEPKMLDFARRDDPDKLVRLTVFMPTAPDVVDQRTFAGTVSLNGVVQATSANFYTATPAEVFGFTGMVSGFASGFEAAFPTYFSATACGSWVEIEALATGDWTINLTYTDIIDTVIQPSAPVLWERENTYMKPMNRWQVNLAKFGPLMPPQIELVNNPRKVGSNIDGGCYQFSTRYRLRDGSYSYEGPETEVVPVSAQVCGLVASPNAIVVDFSDDITLNNPQALAEVASVDILVRINDSPFKIARTLLKWEFVYEKRWLFQNDVLLEPFQAAGGPFPVQPQTYVPQRANTMVHAQDPNDPATNRVVLGGLEEGFPVPCVPADITVGYSDIDPNPSSYCTVELRIRLADFSLDDEYAYMQPVGKYNTEICFGGLSPNDHVDTAEAKQVLKSGGFIVYVVGTSIYGISEQVIILPTLPCGTVVPTILPGSRNAFDFTANGTAANKCARTHRAGARVIIEDGGEIYQRVRLLVPSGRKIVLRMASHLCSASGTGDIYDLENTSLAWHGTSTNVVGMGLAGQPGTTQDTSECELDIPAGYTGVWDAGYAMVMSCASVPQSPNVPFYAINSYSIDDDGQDYSPTNDIRLTGTKAEKQISYVGCFDLADQSVPPVFPAGNQIGAISAVFPIVGEIVQGRSVTDHNGYSFFSVGYKVFPVNDTKYRLAWFGVTGDPLNPTGNVPAWLNGGLLGPTLLTIVNGGNNNKWEGDLNSSVPLTGPTTGTLNFSGRIAEYVVPNLGPAGCRDWIRTWLDGTVEDTNGNPLPGMAVVVQRGKAGVTAADGTFSIPFYGDLFVNGLVGQNYNNREEDGIYVFSTSTCTVTFANGGYSGPYLVNNFEAGQPYSNGIHFDVGTIIGTVVNASSAISTFPRGWTGRVGLKLYDAHGRQTPVQPIGKQLDIAWKTQDLHAVDPITYPPGTVLKGRPEVSFSINGPVPIPKNGRFVSYQFCITRSTRYSERLDWIIPSAAYATEYKDGGGFTYTDYGSGSARILVLFMDEGFTRFRELNQQTALTDAADLFIDISGPGWAWQKGDRAIIASKSDGTTVFRDVEVTGYRSGALTLDASSIDFEVIGGEEITLYRPAPSGDEASGILFYELPLACYKIFDPFGSPTWSVTTDTLEGGDHWALPTQIPIRPGNDPEAMPPDVPWSLTTLTRYSQSASDLFPSRMPSTGRAWAFIQDAATDYQRVRFRWSQPWYNGSGLAATTFNGVPTFYEPDYRDGPSNAGAIKGSVFMSDVIVFMCDGGLSFAAYTGFVTSQAQGQELLAASQGFVTQVRAFAQKYGTNSPQSVRSWDTWAFAFDFRQASMFAYSVNGMDPKEVYGVSTFLKEEMRKFDGLEPPRVIVGVDDFRDEIWLTVERRTLPGDVEIGGFTLCFTPRTLGTQPNTWIAFFGATPQMYARQHDKMFSVLSGNIWLHDADPAHPNRFYGVDQTAVVTPIVNSPEQQHWLAFESMGMQGQAEFNDADDEPNRVPAGRISFSQVRTETRTGFAAERGIPPDPAFGPLKSYALAIRLVGDPGQPHRILGYNVRGTRRL